MAKDSPWFKFKPVEWFSGNIVIEDFATQGLFVNICALYWHRGGVLTEEDVTLRYKDTQEWQNLKNRIVEIDENGVISIGFLDEQLEARSEILEKRAEAGRIGGRKRYASSSEQALVTVTKKVTKKEPLPKEESQDLIDCKDVYNKFIKRQSGGAGAKFDKVQVKAMKDIISYLKAQIKDDGISVAGVLEHIFNSWDQLDEFTKKRTTLVQINGSIQNILISLKRISDGKPESNKSSLSQRADEAIRKNLAS